MPLTGDALTIRALQLTEDREPFVRATVVRAQRPASAHAGDAAVLDATGRIDGFVGGACVEASVRTYGLRALSAGTPLLLRVLPVQPGVSADGSGQEAGYGQEEGVVQVANPCLSGGAIEIFLEPWLPAPRVVVVGTTPIAEALAAIGAAVGWHMVPSDGIPPGSRADDAALIVASHGRDEEPALEAALRAEVPYVALVASAARGAAVLASLNVDDEQRARVFSPAGLDLGGRTPAEIALSILAQLVAERAGRSAATAAATATATATATVSPIPAQAIDPVCGMSVAAAASTQNVERDGVTVYFCSAGCRRAFLADPDRYAAAS